MVVECYASASAGVRAEQRQQSPRQRRRCNAVSEVEGIHPFGAECVENIDRRERQIREIRKCS